MVKSRCAFIEATSVPGVRESELVEVKVMAELVAQGAQERSKGSHIFSHRSSHPYSDQHRFRSVISKEFCRPAFTDSQRTSRKHTEPAIRDFVGSGAEGQKPGACTPYIRDILRSHRLLNGLGDCE